MKRFFVNLIFVCITVLSGIQVFMIKYSVIEKEEILDKIYREIVNDRREIHMLRAEWSLLNDPERLRVLVKKQTSFEIIQPTQVVSLSDIPDKMVPIPEKKPDFPEQEDPK